MATTHPYFPTTLEIPNYTPPTHALPTLLALFGLIAGAIITLGITVTNYLNPQFPARRKVAAAWFLLSGLLHIHFEGYFIKHRYTLAARSDLFADLWKEYALSDSRYLVTDGFVVAIETLTVIFLGPLCLVTFLAIATDSSFRHVARVATSVCHMYGCLLYFVTAALEGGIYCRPEGLYYWVYFVGLNVPWIIVPAAIAYRSARAIAEGTKAVEERGVVGRRLKLR